MNNGKIVTLSGISGSGKSYLKQHILSNDSAFEALISVTTRKRREGEIDGIDKYFVTKAEIEKNRSNLCAINEVYGNIYAYKLSQIKLCTLGINLITELYYKNIPEFKKEFENVLSVYVLPSDLENTVNELKKRNLEKQDLSRRLNDINKELLFFESNTELFDIVVYNDYSSESCLEFTKKLYNKLRRK